jgi:hypothetical protein
VRDDLAVVASPEHVSGGGQPASEVLLDVDLAADPDDDGDERTGPC